MRALAEIPRVIPNHWFWSGTGKVESCSKHWQARLKRMFELAGIPDGHAHRFRDTFAVELLLSGTTIEEVAALLGHYDTKITQKHYSPWAKARQDRLEASVRGSWKDNPIATKAG